jgi:hypothetical protein
MTDARMPERWLNDRRVNRLSDSAFRAFVCAYMWSVSNRTDGHIQGEDLQLIRSLDQKTLAEMIAVELVWRDDDSWILLDFMETQTSKSDLEVLDNARRADAAKKRRRRAEARIAATPSGPSPPSFKESPRDGRGDVLQDSTGERQARTAAVTKSDENAEDPWANTHIAPIPASHLKAVNS